MSCKLIISDFQSAIANGPLLNGDFKCRACNKLAAQHERNAATFATKVNATETYAAAVATTISNAYQWDLVRGVKSNPKSSKSSDTKVNVPEVPKSEKWWDDDKDDDDGRIRPKPKAKLPCLNGPAGDADTDEVDKDGPPLTDEQKKERNRLKKERLKEEKRNKALAKQGKLPRSQVEPATSNKPPQQAKSQFQPKPAVIQFQPKPPVKQSWADMVSDEDDDLPSSPFGKSVEQVKKPFIPDSDNVPLTDEQKKERNRLKKERLREEKAAKRAGNKANGNNNNTSGSAKKTAITPAAVPADEKWWDDDDDEENPRSRKRKVDEMFDENGDDNDKSSKKKIKKPKQQIIDGTMSVGEDGEKASRSDQTVSEDSRRVFLGNLPFKIDETGLKTYFADCEGEIVGVHWVVDKLTNKFYGSAFITFDSMHAAQKSLELNGQQCQGRPIKVSLAPNGPLGINKKNKRDEQVAKQIKPSETCCTIFIGNLSFDIDDTVVKETFKDCGTIVDIRWVEKNGSFQGCGFCEFENTEQADKAILMHNTTVQGRTMSVSWSTR